MDSFYKKTIYDSITKHTDLYESRGFRERIDADKNHFWRHHNFTKENLEQLTLFINDYPIEDCKTGSSEPCRDRSHFFAYNLLTALSITKNILGTHNKDRLSLKARKAKIKKWKNFIKKGNEFVEDLYGEKTKENPAIEFQAYLYNELGANNMLEFPSLILSISDALDCYESDLEKEKNTGGNTTKLNNKLFYLAIIIVCKKACPSIVKKVSGNRDFQFTPLTNLCEHITKKILKICHPPSSPKDLIKDAINDYNTLTIS